MYRRLLLSTLLVIPLAACTSADQAQQVAENRAITGELMQSLKGALQEAMKEGGPVNAIAVCNEKAPEIATALSAKNNRQVARTSLKVRNPANTPDEWEENVLKAFEKRKAKGEDPKTIEHSEMVRIDGNWNFRYMKAIPTGDICLACHGEDLAPAVKAKLEALYPDDRATGYKLGDLRGAFTIVQPM